MGATHVRSHDAQKQARHRAFTLIEILLALVSVVIGAIAASSAMLEGMRGVQANRLALLAVEATSQQMEAVRSEPFAQLSSHPASASFTTGVPEVTGMIYVCSYNPSTAACDAGGNPNIKRVTVAVTQGGRTWRLASLRAQ